MSSVSDISSSSSGKLDTSVSDSDSITRSRTGELRNRRVSSNPPQKTAMVVELSRAQESEIREQHIEKIKIFQEANRVERARIAREKGMRSWGKNSPPDEGGR